jgi:hypothetical protein
MNQPQRIARSLVVPHLPTEDKVMADEVQNVRAFGSTELQAISDKINLKLATMTRAHDATLEFGRIGAVKGVILDADGTTTIYNLFTEFGLSQTQVDFVLGTTTTEILTKATAVSGAIEDELGAAIYDHVHVFCGKTFWDKFITHPNVKTAYQYYQATGQNMNPLRDDLRYKGFQFAGLVWEEYRGKVGGVSFVADAEAYAFPVGVPGLFQTYFAPADFIETVNTNGLPRYAKQAVDPEFGRWVKLHMQSNPLSINTRPKTSIKLITSN